MYRCFLPIAIHTLQIYSFSQISESYSNQGDRFKKLSTPLTLSKYVVAYVRPAYSNLPKQNHEIAGSRIVKSQNAGIPYTHKKPQKNKNF